jgi:hypothetical protein
MCLFESGVSFYLGTLEMPVLWRPHWRKLAISSRKHVLNENEEADYSTVSRGGNIVFF